MGNFVVGLHVGVHVGAHAVGLIVGLEGFVVAVGAIDLDC